jgi:hypothetical protein
MASVKPSRQAVRLEQGDTSRVTAPAKRQPAVAAKPAAKPVKTAAAGRRSS